MTNYAVQVWFDRDWMYLTESKGESIRVMTWDSFEEAEKAMKEMFNVMDKVRVVGYEQ